ncbi:hypothetical protein RJT34_04716 [Clitoria ternatea]|uniref:DUF4378 domain-containing protein n=1 Tax=Clitoria ternatea TaxID=43366 RepID=A0AAN9KPK7_CLITE
MHFKGLLNKSFVKDPKLKLLQVHHSNDPNSKQVDDLSHIALKKPPFLLHQESVKTHKSNPPEELSIRKLKAEIISSKMIKNRKGSTSINMGKELERDASKLLNKVEGPKFMKGVVKLDVKGINYIEASSGKVELHCHIGHTSHVNETVDKKWKVHTVSRKQPENDVSEPRIVTRPQYQQEITTAKFSKPKRGSRIDKNEISCLKSTGSNNNSIYKAELQKANNSKDLNIEIKKIDSMVDSLTHRKNQMKNTSPAAEHEPAKLTVEQMRQGEEKKSIDVLGKEDYTEIRVATTLEDELLMVCEVDTCTYKNGGSDHIMLLKSEQENDSILAEEAHENNSSKVDSITHDTEGAKLKHFLLTSQTFIGHAEKLFNLDVDCPKNLQKGETNHGIANLRLYLDCANELMDLKSLQESQVVGSFLLNCVGNSRLRISLGRLVGEIYDAIENLKFYNEDSEEKRFAGNVFDMMEKDMRCNGVVNSVWERGWKHGFSADEVEQVVNEIESMLISGLIEETIL